jgi:PadR family transcriptional regulator, regulatory protein PadR
MRGAPGMLQALLSEPARELSGLEIAAVTGLRSGAVHPVLARLERMGWAVSRWEDIDPHAEGRPARRNYQLTAPGLPRASHVLTRAESGSRHVRPLHPAGEQR